MIYITMTPSTQSLMSVDLTLHFEKLMSEVKNAL